MVTAADCDAPVDAAVVLVFVHVNLSSIFSFVLASSIKPIPSSRLTPTVRSFCEMWERDVVVSWTIVVFSVDTGSPGFRGGLYGKVIGKGSNRSGSIAIGPLAAGSAFSKSG